MANTGFAVGDWKRVADGIYIAVAEPATVNIGLIVGTDAALMVDTGSSPRQAAAVRATVPEVTDVPLCGAVITHGHFDHAFGIAGVADLGSIGHDSVADDLNTADATAKATELGADPAALQPPSRAIAVADAVELGGNRVAEITYLGPAHSAGDLAVTVTDADVIFAGDLIETAGPPWWGTDSVPDQWPWAVHQLATLAGPQTRVIPGHGDPIDRESVLAQRDTVDGVRSEIERLFNAGVSADDALAAGEWSIPAEHVAGGITARYAQLRSAATGQTAAADTGGRTTLPLA